jgi:adenylate cyclase
MGVVVMRRRDILKGAAVVAVGPPSIPTLPAEGLFFTALPLAWEAFLAAGRSYRRFTPLDNSEARKHGEEALRLDPAFSRAHSLLAGVYRQDSSGWWSNDPDASERLAFMHATHATSLARLEKGAKPSLPYALEQMGWVLLYRGEHEAALETVTEARVRYPTFAHGYALHAAILTYQGYPERALVESHAAARLLHPKPAPFFYDYHQGQAYYVWGVLAGVRDRAKEAEACLKRALAKEDNFRPARSYLAAALWELGREREAVEVMEVSSQKGEPLLRHLREAHPARGLAHVERITPYVSAQLKERLYYIWRATALGEVRV